MCCQEFLLSCLEEKAAGAERWANQGSLAKAFETAANNAKEGCPISRLLNTKITMEFKTRNWKGAIAFINEAGVIAESEEVSHHPGTSIVLE